MRPGDIERLLKQLENGEISEDEESADEDIIDYYKDWRQVQLELEDDDDLAGDGDGAAAAVNSDETDHVSDPPLVNDGVSSDTVETNQSVPLVNYTGNLRGIVWKVKPHGLCGRRFQF